MDEPWAALHQRLDGLEQENRWWRRFGGVVAAGFVAVVLLGAGPATTTDEIHAKRFTLLDNTGKARARLEMAFDEPRFCLFGKDERCRVVLHLVGDLPQLGLFDTTGVLRAKVGVDPVPDGDVRIELRAKDGKNRLALSVPPNAAPGLVLSDGDRPRLLTVVLPDGTASMTFYDKKRPRAAFGLSANGSPSLLLTDAEERARAALRVLDDGKPSFQLADDNGRVIWKAP